MKDCKTKKQGPSSRHLKANGVKCGLVQVVRSRFKRGLNLIKVSE